MKDSLIVEKSKIAKEELKNHIIVKKGRDITKKKKKHTKI